MKREVITHTYPLHSHNKYNSAFSDIAPCDQKKFILMWGTSNPKSFNSK